ncbi:MAG: ABC transporter permease [Armatimonadota bacterium]|nr:ABC transporter permease [Armatimonadota bacterium]MDR7519576.1 ABC transporter permease [Armatimonadota bacterium]MDR7550147.1 ABC transporter permease [Armatimonadota bacterium]
MRSDQRRGDGSVDLLRYRDLLLNLVAAELRAKYRGSALGFLWSLLNPLALIVIYSIAFRSIIRIPIERFPVFLIAGILPWTFFSSSSMAATISLMVNASLLKKVRFPREIIPASVVLFHLVQKVLALVVFLPSLLVLAGHLPWTLVFYPMVLGLQVLFVMGVAMALSVLTVAYRDLRHLTEVALTMLFWLTPIVYRADMVPATLRLIFAANPMTSFVSAFQDITYWGRPPDPGTFLAMAGWAGASLVVGLAMFRQRAAYVAEDL